MRTTPAFAAMAFLIASVLPAQMAPAAQAPLTPPGWAWRMDRPAEPQRGGTGNAGDAKFEFTHMAPGWHITMGPGGVLFPASDRAEGRFALEAEMIYFGDGADGAEHGVVVGGTGLDGEHGSWTAFVVRPDGQAAVMSHAHGATRMLMDWRTADGVRGRDSTGFARNKVMVRAEPDSVRFVVNGMAIAAWPRAAMVVDGGFGFRIGRGANLHITNLDVMRRLAPYPVRR